MRLPLQITLRDIHHSDAIEQAIREKAEKLNQFHSNIMACRVTVETPAKHKNRGKEFMVAIDLTVPGNELVINRERNEDLYVALRDAFNAARRQLEELARKQREAHRQPALA
jgi:ribosomal subunit interface protein